jgi:predicted cobalt transporter CbtA
VVDEKIDGYRKDDYNLGDEVILNCVGAYARVLIAVITPVPGKEVGKITGFDSGLHFNLPGFSSLTLNPGPGCVPVLGLFSRGSLNLFTAARVILACWLLSDTPDPRLGHVLAYERFGGQVTWKVAS